jgi:hypothetical protein
MFVEGKVKNQNRDDKHIHINNPVEKYNIAWTDDFHWDRVFSIEDARGETANAKFEYAQNKLLESGGGVVYFPAGTYHFLDHIKLKSGIIIRGAEPVNSEKHNPIVPEEYPEPFIDAREPRYTLGTYFRFPEYNPVFEGTGTNINTAFKGIRLANPENGNFCGVVNIDIDHGHIALGEKQAMTENYKNGVMNGNLLVYGCILTNTAVADTLVPYDFQHPWQRWIDRNYAAITIFGCKNILVANNRIPEDNHSNFLMQNYRLYPNRDEMNKHGKVTKTDVRFDYENRTGIRVNFMPLLHQLRIWDTHEELQKAVEHGTYDEFIAPGGLAKGIVIRNNYVFSSGRGGIKSTGDGTYIAFNVIRTRPNVILPTANGRYMDAHVNEVRAIEIRGWRWTIEGNDYDVHSNYTPEGIKYNDGEGIMHESWENVGIRDSKILNNVGNRYICVWRVPARGLKIEGNRLRIKQNWHAIFINSQSRPGPEILVDLPCEHVVIKNNITEGSGIKMVGENGTGNIIENNQHTLIHEGKIINGVDANQVNNKRYEMVKME